MAGLDPAICRGSRDRRVKPGDDEKASSDLVGFRSNCRKNVLLLAAAFFAAALAGTGPALAAKAEHKEGGAKEGAARDATDSIKLPPITVPLISAGNVVGQAGVLVQLQLANPGDFGLVDRERGHLVDAFFRELYVLFDQLQGVSSEVSAPIIKEHLTHAADRILGPGKIRDILILGSYERRRPS